MSESFNCKVIINNFPKILPPGKYYVVVRRDDKTCELWYYGAFEDYCKAKKSAAEIGNGLVLEMEFE